MSYDHNLFIGPFVEVQACRAGLHWILDEKSDVEIQHQTDGRATVADVRALEGCHVVFPEFLNTDVNVLFIMLPGYQTVDDICRSDGFIREVCAEIHRDLHIEGLLMKVFGATSVKWKFGVIKEVI